MNLTLLDWTVIALYFLFNLGIGLYYARRARGSTSEFFLSGRDVPWWLAGTSMVATTFAADTPLLVTGLVVKNGIAGNWLWWNMVMSGMLTVFFYARLWRRAGVMTDIEFAELRYSGKPAAFLRGFRALYLGIPSELHHPRLGEPGDDQDPSRNAAIRRLGSWHRLGRRAATLLQFQRSRIAPHTNWNPLLYLLLHNYFRSLGCAGHRLVPIRIEDGNGNSIGHSGDSRGRRNRLT
jgi:hypothetical protein